LVTICLGEQEQNVILRQSDYCLVSAAKVQRFWTCEHLDSAACPSSYIDLLGREATARGAFVTFLKVSVHYHTSPVVTFPAANEDPHSLTLFLSIAVFISV